ILRPKSAKRWLQEFRTPARIPALSVRLPPLLLRLEHNCGFHHAHGRGICRSFGLADFAEYTLDFRELPQELVWNLKIFRRFGYRDARQGDRHIKDRAFVQWRHEFRSELEIYWHSQGDKEKCSGNHQPF